MDDTLPTELWVSAHVRKCTSQGIPVYISKRGEGGRGTLIVKIIQKDFKCSVLTQTRDLDGNMGWMDAFDGEKVDENTADQYIGRATSRDPDLWVVEVEDATGQNPFEGKVF